MAKNLILSLFTVLVFVFVSCSDNPSEPVNDITKMDGKYVFYTNLNSVMDKTGIVRYNTETNLEVFIKKNAYLIGTADKRLYYTTYNPDDSEYSYFSCDYSGNDERMIAKGLGTEYFHPLLSPDGKKIIYYRDNQADGKFEIHCSGIEGSNDQIIHTTWGDYGMEPFAAFTSDSKKVSIVDVNHMPNIWIYENIAGTPGLNKIAELYGFGFMGGSYSPDGSKFVYNSFGNQYKGFDYDTIFTAVYDYNSQKMSLITFDNVYSFNLTWSPDGSKLAFFRLPDKLCIMNADGSNLRQIVYNAGIPKVLNMWSIFVNVSWSPDGSKVLFVLLNNEDLGYNDLVLLDIKSLETKTLLYKVSILNSFWY